MGNATGPAPKKADAFLFGRHRSGLNKLQRQSREELRQRARNEYWAEKQQRESKGEQ